MSYAGATIVAFHGTKPAALDRWLGDLHTVVPGLVPRDPAQIHATVLGLERPFRPVSRPDLDGLRAYVAEATADGIPLRFGGYAPGRSGFTSRGEDPYVRSFALSGGRAVLLGWPLTGPSTTFSVLRQGAERFGFRHRYGYDDADCYLVVGEADEGPSGSVRDYLVGHPLEITLRPEDLRIVCYRTSTLEVATSVTYPVTGPLTDTAAAQILAAVESARR